MALSGALCYTELAVRYPASGGEYVYLRHGFGDIAAFLYGWMSSVVMYPGVAAALAVGASAYIAALLPTAKLTCSWVAAVLLMGFGGGPILGTRFIALLMTALNVLKFSVLFGLVGCVVFTGHGRISNLMPFASRVPGSEPWLGAVAGAVMSGFFSFGGWWEAGKLAGEIRNPKRNLPIAFVGGVLLVTAVYLAISFAFLSVVPIAGMSSGIAFVSQFGQALFGPAGVRLLAACVLLCVAGGLAALMMAAPRVSFAMAQTGQFLPLFARRHPRFGTPANAILLQTGLALAALLFGTFDRILAYIIFSAVLFLGLTVATLFRVRPRTLAWWFPAAPMLFLGFCALVASLLLLRAPVPALFGMLIVLLGLPLHRALRRHSAPPLLASERT